MVVETAANATRIPASAAVLTFVKGSLYVRSYPISGMFKDPVCKMMVDEKTATNVSEASGKKIYLCSPACKTQFDANPKKFGY